MGAGRATAPAMAIGRGPSSPSMLPPGPAAEQAGLSPPLTGSPPKDSPLQREASPPRAPLQMEATR